MSRKNCNSACNLQAGESKPLLVYLMCISATSSGVYFSFLRAKARAIARLPLSSGCGEVCWLQRSDRSERKLTRWTEAWESLAAWAGCFP